MPLRHPASARPAVLALLLAVSLTATPAGPAAAGQGPPEATGPVELTGQRTETTRVFLNPSGTRTMEIAPTPVRTRRDDDWVPIDTTLTRNADGSVSPKATVTGLRLSAGGDGPFATLTHDGKELSLTWPESLPEPALNGNTATYPEVMPGVDLQLRADVDGFSHVLIVKNATAAANPRLRSVKFGTSTRGLTIRPGEDGATSLVDTEGRSVFGSPAPQMWESARQVVSASPVAQPKQRTMETRLGAGELTVVPDQRLLTGPDTVYPVYIDPSFSLLQNRWTYVNKEAAGTSYWTTKDANKMRVGATYGGDGIWRTLFQMNSASLAGSQITRTWVSVTMDHSAACGATGVELWNTKAIDPAVALTWTNSAAHWLTLMGSASGSANESSACPKPDLPMEFASTALTKVVQDTATASRDTVAFGLRINSSGETAETNWKYFYASTARLNVEFNSRPRTPTDVSTAPPKPCGTATAPTSFNTSTPEFSAVISDPDGDNISGELEILNGDTVLKKLTTPMIGSGGAFGWPALESGVLPEDQPTTVFNYRARARDALQASADTARCYFTVDKVRPGTPGLSSTDYPSGTPVRSVGETGTVTLNRAAGDTDIAGYRYGFQAERVSMWVNAEPDGKATIPITLWPDSPGGSLGIDRTLFVRAVDHAGNGSSALATWNLTANPRTITAPPISGDTNGDRRADITTLFDQGDGRTAAWNLLSTGTGFTPGYIGWDTGTNGGFSMNQTANVRGDFNDDGRTDVAVFREDPDRKVRLFFLESDGNRLIALGEPAWTGTTYHLSYLRLVAGDFDGDGDDDLGAFQGYPGGQTKLWVHTAQGGRFSEPALAWDSGAGGLDQTTVSFVSGDFDGDGRSDIGQLRGSAGAQTKLWVQYATATGFAAPVQQWDSGAGNLDREESTFHVGNANGDAQRRDEIVVMTDRGGLTAQLSVLTAGTGTWTNGVWWSGTSFDTTKAVVSTGDFSGDGKADVAVLYATGKGNRRAYTFTSTGTSFADERTDWEGQIGDTTTPVYVETARPYRLYAKHSDKCLEVAANNVANGTVLRQGTCTTGAKNQQFVVQRLGATEFFALKPVSSAKCIDVESWKHNDGATIWQWTCSTGGFPQANQQFRLDYVEGSGVDVVIQPRIVHSEKCMEVTGASQAVNTAVVQATCAATKDNQKYYLRPEP